MNWAQAEQLIEIFRQEAKAERHGREMALLSDRLDDDRKNQRRERHEKEELERFEQLVEATEAQIAAFHETLDTYDTATVQALMENQKALDAVRDRIAAIEAAAHRLPDGRMVFKTEDGKRVFDRDGVQLSHDSVDPDAIPDAAPRWEMMKQSRELEQKIEDDRAAIHAFQQRVDDTRETVDKEHLSAEELARMDADLQKAMPESVKMQMPGASAPGLQDRPTAARAMPPVPSREVPFGP